MRLSSTDLASSMLVNDVFTAKQRVKSVDKRAVTSRLEGAKVQKLVDANKIRTSDAATAQRQQRCHVTVVSRRMASNVADKLDVH